MTPRRRPTRVLPVGLVVAGILGLGPGGAIVGGAAWAAQPTLLVADQKVTEEGEIEVLVAGRDRDGSPAGISDLQLVLDGKGIPASARAKIADVAAEDRKWVPPFAVGVVYLWVKGTSHLVLEGLEGYFRQFPDRLQVYPTPYGQGHLGVMTKLTASQAKSGDLSSPPIDGDDRRLVPAVRFNIGKLREDPAPKKFLLIVTDGRDPGNGREGGPLAALGQDLRRDGMQVAIVYLRDSDADVTANVQELAEQSRARLVIVEKPQDLAPVIQSMAELASGFERVRFKLPWTASKFGSDPKATLRGTVKGAPRAVTITVATPGGGSNLILIGGAALFVVGGGVVLLLVSRRGRKARGRAAPLEASSATMTVPPEAHEEHEDDGGGAQEGSHEAEALLAPTEEVIFYGLRPARAVLSLSRALGPDAEKLVAHDPSGLAGGESPLQTAAGQARLHEIQRVLSGSRALDRLAREVGPVLAGALRDGVQSRDGARRLRAKLPVESWSALLRIAPEQLAGALSRTSALGEHDSPQGRRYAEEVQRALFAEGPRRPVVAWLMRVAGPGEAGEIIPLQDRAMLGGARAQSVLSHADPALADQHAEVTLEGNELVLTPMGGPVDLDGAPLRGPAALSDGQLLGMGNGLYVVCVVRHSLAVAGGAPMPERRAPDTRGGRTRGAGATYAQGRPRTGVRTNAPTRR